MGLRCCRLRIEKPRIRDFSFLSSAFLNNLAVIQHSHAGGDAKGAIISWVTTTQVTFDFRSGDNNSSITEAITGSRPRHRFVKKDQFRSRTSARARLTRFFIPPLKLRVTVLGIFHSHQLEFFIAILSISSRDLTVSSSEEERHFATVRELSKRVLINHAVCDAESAALAPWQTVDFNCLKKNRTLVRHQKSEMRRRMVLAAAASDQNDEALLGPGLS